MNSSDKAAKRRKEHNNKVLGMMAIERLWNAGLNEEEILKVLLENMYEVMRERGVPEKDLKPEYIEQALEEFRNDYYRQDRGRTCGGKNTKR